MLELIVGLGASLVASGFGFKKAQTWTENKLRYVPAAQGKMAPVVAGVGATAVGAVAVALLPIVGAGTALAFGVAVGLGVKSGQDKQRITY